MTPQSFYKTKLIAALAVAVLLASACFGGYNPPLDGTLITNLSFDLRYDPSSPTNAGGNYGLLLTAADLPTSNTDGPHLLAAEPGEGAALAGSPFVLRLGLSAAPDPTTISQYSPNRVEVSAHQPS